MTATAPPRSPGITITPPRWGDVMALRRLFRLALQVDFQYFPTAYAAEISAQNSVVHLAVGRLKPDRVMLIAKRDGRLIGYAIGSLTPEGNGELYWLYVDQAERQRKVGVALLHATLAAMQAAGAKRISLVTYDLKDYYLHQGFHHRGKQHIHGVDLDVMEYVADGSPN